MFNNQPTQVLITLHEDDKSTLSQILHAAAHWPDHFNLITGNDGPYPTATICFDGINALSHFCSSGIMAGVEFEGESLFALDDLVVEVKSIAIYNSGQVVDPRIISPTGQAFVVLARAYCNITSNVYRPSPRAIPRDKVSGFMDLSENRNERYSRTCNRTRTRNVSSGFSLSGLFGPGTPALGGKRWFGRPLDVEITLSNDNVDITISDVSGELLERTVVKGGVVFKIRHSELDMVTEKSLKQALHKVGINSAWLDTENNIINIVVPDKDNATTNADVLTFDISLDFNLATDKVPTVVLEDKDGDFYPHIAEEYENGYYYQSDLLRGLTEKNINDLNEAAERNGLSVVYDSEVGSIQLIKVEEANEVSVPKLEIHGELITLDGVAAQVLEKDDRQFEIIFDQDLPMNKHDYAATLRELLLGRRSKGFNSSWNINNPNVLVVRLSVGDKSKSVKTMRAAVAASKIN